MSVSALRIYTAKVQPATDFVDYSLGGPRQLGYAGGKLIWCDCCGKRHPARDVVLHCYYGGRQFWCAKDRGCKNPRLIEAKRRREYRNRSAGQKRRWAHRLGLT